MNELVKAGQFKVPREGERRLKFALQGIWVGSIMLAITVAATLFVAFTTGDMAGLGAMIGLDLVVAGVLTWALYWYYTHAQFDYEVLGLQVRFQGTDYYVPPENMLQMVRAVMNTWNPHLDVDAKEVYDGVSLTVLEKQPDHPFKKGEKAIGLTYHSSRRSLIWGPYALNTGGAGYELMLHAAEYKWPNSTEGQKLEGMKKLGLIEGLRRTYQNELDK